MNIKIWINGELCEGPEATVSVLDRGFLYGDSVFETLRTYRRQVFALEEHLERLHESARRVLIDLPVTREQLAHEIKRALLELPDQESYIRLMVTRGEGGLGLDPKHSENPKRVMIITPLKVPDPEVYLKGAKAISYACARPQDDTAAAGAKIGNYLVAVLAHREAAAAGAIEALLVGPEDTVTEGATSNLFWIEKGRVFTPDLSAGVLAGITRHFVLRAAERLGLQVQLQTPTLTQLLEAEEVFISSSIRELVPIVRVDEQIIGQGRPGSLTQKLLKEFRAYALDVSQVLS
ncbi:MAG: aminotransferase class IV [Polyangiaceae bacterium]|nr:aminotransferase class IV [Polyangiaceae bacterium]